MKEQGTTGERGITGLRRGLHDRVAEKGKKEHQNEDKMQELNALKDRSDAKRTWCHILTAIRCTKTVHSIKGKN